MVALTSDVFQATNTGMRTTISIKKVWQPKRKQEESTLTWLTIKERAQLLHRVFLPTLSQDVAAPLFDNNTLKGPTTRAKQAVTRHKALVSHPLLVYCTCT